MLKAITLAAVVFVFCVGVVFALEVRPVDAGKSDSEGVECYDIRIGGKTRGYCRFVIPGTFDAEGEVLLPDLDCIERNKSDEWKCVPMVRHHEHYENLP